MLSFFPRDVLDEIWDLSEPVSEGFFLSTLGRQQIGETPSNFIAGRPKAALLFWFFGEFRCCVLLFIVILVLYIKI